MPYETAKKWIINFFREYPGLKKWIETEVKASRKRGYSRTAFGRRRPLLDFYNNPDKKIQAKGDRCAVNAIIQGGASDLIKIALYRLWKWVRENGLQDDVRILLPIHDEILFEIKEEKLLGLVPEICRIMRMADVTKALGWPVPLEVDAEYGDSFHVDHDFWKEMKDQIPPTTPPVPNDSPEAVAVEEPTVDPSPVIENPVTKEVLPEVTEESSMTMTVTEEKPVVGNTISEAMQYYVNINVKHAFSDGVEDKEDMKNVLRQTTVSKDTAPLFQDAHTMERIDKEGYFHYPVEIDSVSARTLKHILEILRVTKDKVFIGPMHKVCLLSNEGEVYYRTSEPVSVDAFIALCLAYNI
jgi:hypothetical protein